MTVARVPWVAILLFVLAGGVGEPSMAIERAKYVVSMSDPPYEIRDYSTAVVAVVTVRGTRNDAVSSGFRILAKYIFGDNREKSKIAMTAPVTQSRLPSEPTATAAGEAESPDRESWIVRFMMPAGYTLQSLPAPDDRRVHFEQVPAHPVVAIRFSGFWSDANLQSHKAQLLQWMQKQHLPALSAPTYAYYDPPWTPWFMRTIDVLVDTVRKPP